MDRKLTNKQELFVLEFLKDLNATRAYKDVYWVKQKVAEAAWPRLLGNVRVQAALKNKRDNRCEKLEIDWERVIKELISIVKKCTQQEPIKARVLKSNTIESEGWETKVTKEWEEIETLGKFDSSGANTALANLWKYFKLFNDQVDVNHKFNLSSLFDKSSKIPE